MKFNRLLTIYSLMLFISINKYKYQKRKEKKKFHKFFTFQKKFHQFLYLDICRTMKFIMIIEMSLAFLSFYYFWRCVSKYIQCFVVFFLKENTSTKRRKKKKGRKKKV